MGVIVANEDGGFHFLRLFLAGAIGLLWAVSVVVQLVNPERPVDPWVHLLAAAMATALFGPTIWKRG